MDSFLRFARDTVGALMPLENSVFETNGQLTAREFLLAGDQLVSRHPNWQWSAGKGSRARPWLPQSKQYLVCSGCPCVSRVFDLESCAVCQDTNTDTVAAAATEDASVEDGNWHNVSDMADAETDRAWQNVSERVAADDEVLVQHRAVASSTNPTATVAIDDDLLLDPSIFLDPSSVKINRVQARHYDLTIVYDSYYRVPRLFLSGFDASGAPLSHHACFQDCVSDYVKKTVTVEAHPHTGEYQLSVHPCMHGAAVLRMVNLQKERGCSVSVDQYLFLLLKFLSAIIPTIEWDHTSF